ncbi:MAG TPA: VTT domain-containing protein [Terracidiphilus sp.]|nr:VTT domain-containing protein [Terracidiphilus sp.]
MHWLLSLGLPGLFGVAIVDSSPIPLPLPGSTDLLVLWLASHGGQPWELAACAFAGALLGGFLGWRLGRKGGEEALKRRVPARMLDPVHRWARGNPFLAVFLPALLPPPVPLSPFVLAAGALGVPQNRFLISFGAARAIRYSVVAWLGATYGRRVMRVWSHTLDQWSMPILATFLALMAGGIVFAIVKARRKPKESTPGRARRESAAD